VRFLGLPYTLGSGVEAEAPDASAQWVWQADLGLVRTYPPRVRDDYWVEIGHIETDDPATDSREG
jgi:hypothetical protein